MDACEGVSNGNLWASKTPHGLVSSGGPRSEEKYACLLAGPDQPERRNLSSSPSRNCLLDLLPAAQVEIGPQPNAACIPLTILE